MRTPKRVIKYAKENLTEVLHTTLNPEGPGVVRIHLVPPVLTDADVKASVAIINGQDIVPVNTSWTILLAELIKEVNKYEGKPVNEETTQDIIDNTVKNVRKVFPFVGKKVLRQDIYRIMKSLTQVARRQPVDEAIEFISIGEYAPNMKAPHRMDLLVSAMTKEGKWHCNQSCVHCYAAGQKCAEESELNTNQWKAIIDKCRAVGIPQITFTGGEPTMREDLFELIDYAKWFVTRLNTNGIKLTEEYCNKLRDASIDSVQITFYSSDEEVHNKLVGAAGYNNTLSGIKNALAAGLNISINTPLCTLNRDYAKTLSFLHDLGVTYVTCSGLITTGNAEGEESSSLQLNSDELKEILKEAVKFCYQNGMEISFTSPGWIEESFFNNYGLNPPSCGACLSNMAVTPGGNVVPCQSYLSTDAIGSMLVDDWETIWNSEACVSRRDYSAKMYGTCPLRK